MLAIKAGSKMKAQHEVRMPVQTANTSARKSLHKRNNVFVCIPVQTDTVARSPVRLRPRLQSAYPCKQTPLQGISGVTRLRPQSAYPCKKTPLQGQIDLLTQLTWSACPCKQTPLQGDARMGFPIRRGGPEPSCLSTGVDSDRSGRTGAGTVRRPSLPPPSSYA